MFNVSGSLKKTYLASSGGFCRPSTTSVPARLLQTPAVCGEIASRPSLAALVCRSGEWKIDLRLSEILLLQWWDVRSDDDCIVCAKQRATFKSMKLRIMGTLCHKETQQRLRWRLGSKQYGSTPARSICRAFPTVRYVREMAESDATQKVESRLR